MACVKVTIRAAQERDLELINYYASLEGMDKIDELADVFVACNEEDLAVGFIRIHGVQKSNKHYVNPVVVYSQWRGFGVGKLLMQYTHDVFGPLYLVSRGSSLGFYEQMGLVPVDSSCIDEEILSDCRSCEMQGECNPQPMYFE